MRDDLQYPEIREARAHLARSYRYFRRRLEEAMVEGVGYPGGDFAVLLANPTPGADSAACFADLRNGLNNARASCAVMPAP